MRIVGIEHWNPDWEFGHPVIIVHPGFSSHTDQIYQVLAESHYEEFTIDGTWPTEEEPAWTHEGPMDHKTAKGVYTALSRGRYVRGWTTFVYDTED